VEVNKRGCIMCGLYIEATLTLKCLRGTKEHIITVLILSLGG